MSKAVLLDGIEENPAWMRVKAYIEKCHYDWTYNRLLHDYQTYYMNDAYYSYTSMDIVKNNEDDCRILFG